MEVDVWSLFLFITLSINSSLLAQVARGKGGLAFPGNLKQTAEHSGHHGAVSDISLFTALYILILLRHDKSLGLNVTFDFISYMNLFVSQK